MKKGNTYNISGYIYRRKQEKQHTFPSPKMYKNLNFRPYIVRLGLIEDIKNDAGDIISIGNYTGLQNDIPEETSNYYEIQNGELVEIEYDEDTNSWEEA